MKRVSESDTLGLRLYDASVAAIRLTFERPHDDYRMRRELPSFQNPGIRLHFFPDTMTLSVEEAKRFRDEFIATLDEMIAIAENPPTSSVPVPFRKDNADRP